MINRGNDGDGDFDYFYGDLINELAEKNITYNIDDNAVLRVYVGNRIWFECQDVHENTQALDIIGDELPRLNGHQEWREELLRKLDLDDDLDEKYAKGVYDMALDIAGRIGTIVERDNKDIAHTLYYNDAEIACLIYDAIKYGRF